MGEPIQLNRPRNVLPTIKPVAETSNNTGNTVTQVRINPDIKIVIKDPTTPPNMIIPKTVTPIAALQTKKPEFTVDLSKYFQTNFIDLDYQIAKVHNKLFLISVENPTVAMPCLKGYLGKPKNRETHWAASQAMLNHPEVKQVLAFAKRDGLWTMPNGKVGVRIDIPYGIDKELELVAKQYVYFYASHKYLDDYGMDIDYLTFPVIDVPLTKEEIGPYLSFPIVTSLYNYDQLFDTYDGVSTMGRLGRKLGIDGVELYNVWKQLKASGNVANMKWSAENRKGKMENHQTPKFLEIPKDLNVDKFVEGLDVSSNLRPKLVKYLKGLQNGKRRNLMFKAKYDILRDKHKSEVLVKDYLLAGFRTFSRLYGLDGHSQEGYRKDYMPVLDKWMDEYNKFERYLLSGVKSLNTRSEKVTAMVYDKLIKELESKKKEFGGEIPIGPEILFMLMEAGDASAEEKKDTSVYEIKYR